MTQNATQGNKDEKCEKGDKRRMQYSQYFKTHWLTKKFSRTDERHKAKVSRKILMEKWMNLSRVCSFANINVNFLI